MSSPPVAVVREVPKRGQGAWQTYTVAELTAGVTGKEDENKGWESLRINVSHKDLDDEKKYCKDQNQKAKSFWSGNEEQCKDEDVLNDEKKKELIEKILPEAIKLHTDRLLVKPMKTPWNVIPFENTNFCSHFTIPKKDDGKLKVDEEKLPETNFMLYVATGSRGNNAPRSWALTCAVDANDNNRPIIGAMRVNPKNIAFGKGIVRLLAHELGHALGFDYERMNERGMITVRDIRGEDRIVVKSNKTLMKAKEHYDCDTMEGVELQVTNGIDNNGPNCTHWTQRYAKDELMSITKFSVVYENIGYYTALTIAAFEDMGFYKGKFEMAENMSWGRGAGCELIKGTYKEELEKKYPNMFCKYEGKSLCASNRMGMGTCSERESNNGDINFVTQNEFALCTSKELTPGYGVGRPDSWCLDTDDLVRRNNDENSTSYGVCGEVRCDTGFVEVRFDDKDEWHKCDEEDQTFKPNMAAAFDYVSGKVKCPKYSEV
ncbi:surface protease GP63, partial [Trypanosoma theileri]